ncbi:MAG TPA: 3-octaprenyl-4-hydroxybenzoate carboxy-lyase, partial [Desulfobacteraceae bacterium]|nr:3-octaprenyl-4-hydroxybenzoate carboxy-lyase [Desulfobacteraceae bacterium]
TAFSRSNPSHDIYGLESFTRFRHWGCSTSLIIDARRKPFHAPPLAADRAVAKGVERLGVKNGSLYGLI